MLQRTNGRILLALLVITGLAGTVTDTTLTKDERRNALTLFKDSRTKILTAVEGLSPAQLAYKPAADAWNIQDCITHMALSEKELWAMMERGLKEPANPAIRDSIRLTDQAFMGMVRDRSVEQISGELLQPARAQWTNASEAITAFRTLRTAHIKYVRSTTENLRNHVIRLPFAYADAYQVMLLVATHSERQLAQIEAIKASGGYPRS